VRSHIGTPPNEVAGTTSKDGSNDAERRLASFGPFFGLAPTARLPFGLRAVRRWPPGAPLLLSPHGYTPEGCTEFVGTIAIRSGGNRDHETRHQTRATTPGAKDPTWAREVVQELRVAALLVCDEAVAVGREERETRKEKVAENLSLQEQG
jgi:hypothetical protein